MPNLPSVEQLHRELEVCEKATPAKFWSSIGNTFWIGDDFWAMLGRKNDAAFIPLARTALPARIRDVLRLMDFIEDYPPAHDVKCRGDAADFFSCTCGLTARLAELGMGGER